MKVLKQTYPIMTTLAEDEKCKKCYMVIDDILNTLIEYDCNEMLSMETGEVITLNDLRRVKGVLSGLSIMSIMYKTE